MLWSSCCARVCLFSLKLVGGVDVDCHVGDASPVCQGCLSYYMLGNLNLNGGSNFNKAVKVLPAHCLHCKNHPRSVFSIIKQYCPSWVSKGCINSYFTISYDSALLSIVKSSVSILRPYMILEVFCIKLLLTFVHRRWPSLTIINDHFCVSARMSMSHYYPVLTARTQKALQSRWIIIAHPQPSFKRCWTNRDASDEPQNPPSFTTLPLLPPVQHPRWWSRCPKRGVPSPRVSCERVPGGVVGGW